MQRSAIPRRQRGQRPPLFDRLFDLDPDAADTADARLLAAGDLRASVARHLGHLLDCRRPAPPPGADLTVLDWGVPDVGSLPARDGRAQAAWTAEVRRSVARFEPRLRDPEVALRRGAECGRSRLCITGSLVSAEAAAPVLFELALEAAAGGA